MQKVNEAMLSYKKSSIAKYTISIQIVHVPHALANIGTI